MIVTPTAAAHTIKQLARRYRRQGPEVIGIQITRDNLLEIAAGLRFDVVYEHHGGLGSPPEAVGLRGGTIASFAIAEPGDTLVSGDEKWWDVVGPEELATSFEPIDETQES